MKLRLITAITLGALYVQAHANPTATQATPTNTMVTTSTAASHHNASQQSAMKPIATMAQANATTSSNSASAAPGSSMPMSSVTMPKISVDKEKVSYGIGFDLGENFKSQGIDVDANMVARGLKDATAGGKTLYTQQEMAATLVDFQKQLIAKRQAEYAAMATKNLQQSNQFLQSNKAKPGITTTASGLQYKIINAGAGVATPTDKDVVTVDYVGSLPTGQIFDSSYKRGKPVTFPVSEVIPGWTEALKLMKPGATYEVFVPANLAYGDRGLPPVIGPNQALVFKIHLIAINKNPTQANA